MRTVIITLLVASSMVPSIIAPINGIAANVYHGLDWGDVEICYDTIFMDRASSYYPSYEQCARRDSLGNIDSTSNIYNTADGSFINMERLRKKEIQWCALPKSMLTEYGGSPFSYGDTIRFYSESKQMVSGKWVVHDLVSSDWGKTVDFLIHPENNRNPKLGLPKDVVILYNSKPVLK